jgi:hypothetical protein
MFTFTKIMKMLMRFQIDSNKKRKLLEFLVEAFWSFILVGKFFLICFPLI